MSLLSVLAAAAAAWIFGAIWYMALSKSWIAVSGVKVGPDGKPEGTFNPTPFILSAVAMVVVAGFMRQIFAASGIVSPRAGAFWGLGIGLFFIAPWTMINNAYPGRPFLLTVIDSGYAIIGCALIGLILTLF